MVKLIEKFCCCRLGGSPLDRQSNHSRQDAKGNDQCDCPEEAGRALGHGHCRWQGPGPHRQARQDQGDHYHHSRVGFGFSHLLQYLQAYSPAEHAGLKEWDYIWSINGQEVFEMSHNQICGIIKSAGTSIQMVVER